MLQQFLAITGADEATALSVLEACDWQLEGAVELHFATGGDVGGGVNPGAAAGASPNHPAAHDPVLAEDEVRAPIPAKMDRLYGDMGMGMAGMGTGLHGIPQARWVTAGGREARQSVCTMLTQQSCRGCVLLYAQQAACVSGHMCNSLPVSSQAGFPQQHSTTQGS